MPWQTRAVDTLTGRDTAGHWLTRQATIVVARQNGKTDMVGARILAGTRFMAERCLYTTASLQASVDLWRRITTWVDATPLLRRAVTDVKRSNGRERLAFTGGGVLQIATSAGRPPRGFDRVNLLIYDEARELRTFDVVEALNPTQTAARPAQRLYISNAGDNRSVVLNARRDAGHTAAAHPTPTAAAYLEWSAPPGAATDDLAALAAANPALGHTITADDLLRARAEMTEAGYRTEHMCQWVAALEQVIDPAAWAAAAWPDAHPGPGMVLAFDVDVDRSAAAVAAAWPDQQGRPVLALLEHRPTAAWVPDLVAALATRYQAPLVGYDGYGPAGDVADRLARTDGITLARLGTAEVTAAAAALVEAVHAGHVRIVPAPPLDAAAAVAARRPVGDRWTWGRRASAGSIAPLTAATFAYWTLLHVPPPRPRPALASS